jgi:hypothetical protein
VDGECARLASSYGHAFLDEGGQPPKGARTSRSLREGVLRMVSAQALASYQVDQADDRSVGFRPAGHPLQLKLLGSILLPRCSENTHTPYHRSTQE